MKQKFTILFDLDGTLVDTAPDLMRAHNHVMKKFGYPTKSTEEIRNLVGKGAGVMIGRSIWGQAKKEFGKVNDEKVKKESQVETKGIEVGHIFYFGDKYSAPLNCLIDSQGGKKTPVKMGSYGIGISRLVGATIEANYNNEIMKWPRSISPFDVVIIPSISKNNKENLGKAEKIYQELKKQNIDVLLDDVDENMSNKFKKHDLIGIPFQIIIGSKSEENKFEFKELNSESEMLSLESIKSKLKR